MIDILDKLRAVNGLCEIYTGSDDGNRCDVGYVVAVTDKHFLLEAVELDGTHGGFIFRHIEDVFRIQYATKYLNKMQRLMDKALFVPKPSPVEGRDILEELLCYVQTAHRICYYSLIDDDFYGYGYVKEFTGMTVIFQRVDPYGCPDGECVVRREDISVLCFGGSDETKLEKLV